MPRKTTKSASFNPLCFLKTRQISFTIFLISQKKKKKRRGFQNFRIKKLLGSKINSRRNHGNKDLFIFGLSCWLSLGTVIVVVVRIVQKGCIHFSHQSINTFSVNKYRDQRIRVYWKSQFDLRGIRPQDAERRGRGRNDDLVVIVSLVTKSYC